MCLSICLFIHMYVYIYIYIYIYIRPPASGHDHVLHPPEDPRLVVFVFLCAIWFIACCLSHVYMCVVYYPRVYCPSIHALFTSHEYMFIVYTYTFPRASAPCASWRSTGRGRRHCRPGRPCRRSPSTGASRVAYESMTIHNMSYTSMYVYVCIYIYIYMYIYIYICIVVSIIIIIIIIIISIIIIFIVIIIIISMIIIIIIGCIMCLYVLLLLLTI